jgi:hypothetical protein
LTGTIRGIEYFTNLKNSSLDRNNFIGTIPALDTMMVLETINLNNNKISGTLPTTMPANLVDFRAGANQLVGILPLRIATLKNVDVSINQLTGTIPSFEGNTAIQAINLNLNQLIGTVPPFS